MSHSANRISFDEIEVIIPSEAGTEARERRKELFRQFDVSGNKKLTFQEVLQGCTNILRLDDYTSDLSTVVQKAFNKAKGAINEENRMASSGSTVEFMEFNRMLRYLRYYLELSVVFQSIDTSTNGLVDLKEFTKGVQLLKQYGVSVPNVEQAFREMDHNGSGNVNLSEFLLWASEKRLDVSGD